jgi:hypothetical protein
MLIKNKPIDGSSAFSASACFASLHCFIISVHDETLSQLPLIFFAEQSKLIENISKNE